MRRADAMNLKIFLVLFIFSVFFAITAFYVSAVPIACWDFENNLTEYTGTFTATSGSTPQYTTGIIGQGVNFTQNTLDYIATSLNPSDLYAAGQENWSMCFWVEPIDLNIRSSWVSTTLDNSNLAAFETYNAFPGNGDFYVITSDIPRLDIQNFSGLNESYTHICIVGFANLTVYAYVNGMFIGNSTSSTSDNFNTFNNTITFGKNGGSTGYARAASGGFDEFKFWNTSLSSTDITDDYNGGTGTNCSFYDALCLPSWSCGSFGACNISNVSACLNVTDGNSCGVEFNGSLSDYDENCSYVQPWSASVVNPTGGISLVVGDSFGGTIVGFYKNENLITSDMTLNAVYLNTTSVGFSGFYYEPYDSGWEWLFTVPAVPDGIYDYVVNATYVNSSNGSDTHEFLVVSYGALNITNPCVENWTCSGYGSCVNLTQDCIAVTDENTCGTNYTGNYSEFSPQACGGTAPSPSIIGMGILIFDLILFLLISVLDGMMMRKSPETNRAFRALYGLIGLIAIVAVLALLL